MKWGYASKKEHDTDKFIVILQIFKRGIWTTKVKLKEHIILA